MKHLRFAFTRRWLGYLAFVIAFAVACVCLANWQLARSKEAAHANELLKRNFDSSPIALVDALPSLDSYRASQEWLRIRVTGEYEQQRQLLVRNRATDDGPGFEVLTPLRTADGSLFIVDRGWVGVGNKGGEPASVAPAPTGEVTAIVRLKPPEPRLSGQYAKGDQVPTIELSDIAKQLDTDVYTGAYGLLQTQTPTPAHALTPVVTSPPTQDEGLHWSYMVQWICFALIGFFGLGYAVRQEYKRHAEAKESDRIGTRYERPSRVAQRRKVRIEDEDDELDRLESAR